MKIMIMLLMICLSSCKYHVICDASFVKDRCRCRCINTDTLKEVDKRKCKKEWKKYYDGIPNKHPINYELEACEGLTGAIAEIVTGKIIPEINDERRECEDLR